MNRERRSLLVALLGFGLLAGQLGFAAAQSANQQADGDVEQPPASNVPESDSVEKYSPDREADATDDASQRADDDAQQQRKRGHDRANQQRQEQQDQTSPDAAPDESPRTTPPNEGTQESDRRDQGETPDRPDDSTQPRDADGTQADRRNRNQDDLDVGIQFDDDVATGLAIAQIAQNSLAARANLRPGDVIVSVDGRRLQSDRQFLNYLGNRTGQRVALVVDRDGAQRTVYLTPEAGPNVSQFQEGRDHEDGRRTFRRDDSGFRPGNLPPTAIGVRVGPGSWGPVVSGIYEGAPAHQAGSQMGDAIVRIDGQRICHPDQFVQAIQNAPDGQPVHVVYHRDGRYHEADIMPGASEEVFAGRMLTQSDRPLQAEATDNRREMRDRSDLPPAPIDEDRFARGEDGRRQGSQTVLRPDIEGMSRIREMQQEIDTLRRELNSLRREVQALQRSQPGEVNQRPNLRNRPAAPGDVEDATEDLSPPRLPDVDADDAGPELNEPPADDDSDLDVDDDASPQPEETKSL